LYLSRRRTTVFATAKCEERTRLYEAGCLSKKNEICHEGKEQYEMRGKKAF